MANGMSFGTIGFGFSALLCAFAATSCGGTSGDDDGGGGGTSGSGTGGSATGGSATGGSATGGSATGGSATGGSATASRRASCGRLRPDSAAALARAAQPARRTLRASDVQRLAAEHAHAARRSAHQLGNVRRRQWATGATPLSAILPVARASTTVSMVEPDQRRASSAASSASRRRFRRTRPMSPDDAENYAGLVFWFGPCINASAFGGLTFTVGGKWAARR